MLGVSWTGLVKGGRVGLNVQRMFHCSICILLVAALFTKYLLTLGDVIKGLEKS